jgi:pyruvate/2-oxoglutarate dehydrogenase complex dihydrolipoamide dehydrogenase (E3) component
MEAFDVIVIGGGSAGYAAARTARETAKKVAIIDKASELGGLCILRGCMPSKTLIYSAEVLHHARHGKDFGLRIPSATVDMQALQERKRVLIKDFQDYRQGQLESDRFTLIREEARFIGPDTLELQPSGRHLTARGFIIATGSVVNFPSIPGLDAHGVWTSDDVLELSELPDSIIVLGGGIVACEMAQFLSRAGVRVIQIQRSPHILKEASTEAAQVIMQAFMDEGIELHTHTHLKSIESHESGYTVHFADSEGKLCQASATRLLNALGRRPAIDNLGLENAAVHTGDGSRIRVNKWQQTDNPRIYAAGDVCGPFEIVHLAIMQGEVAARHALGRDTTPVHLDDRTSVVFTDPQVASAGIPITEAKERGMDLVSADYPFDDHGKSMLMNATYGYVKVWAERSSGQIIGAECVGKDAGELIHTMAVAISLKAKAVDLLKVHWYHPTLAEIWSYPIEDIVDELNS